MHIIFFIAIHYNTFKISNMSCGFEVGIINNNDDLSPIVVSYNDFYCEVYHLFCIEKV